MHIFPWLHELCAAFPWYWKGAFLLPNQASAQRRSSLDCLSFKGNSVQCTSNQRAWASSLVYLPNVLEKWRGEEAGVVFLSTEALELVFVHGNDCTVVPGCYQTLVCRVCDIAILPWLYELALCCIFLVFKGFVMWNHASPQWRSLLEHFSSDGNSVYWIFAQRTRGSTLVYLPNM